jgi:hypothetical protein
LKLLTGVPRRRVSAAEAFLLRPSASPIRPRGGVLLNSLTRQAFSHCADGSCLPFLFSIAYSRPTGPAITATFPAPQRGRPGNSRAGVHRRDVTPALWLNFVRSLGRDCMRLPRRSLNPSRNDSKDDHKRRIARSRARLEWIRRLLRHSQVDKNADAYRHVS